MKGAKPCYEASIFLSLDCCCKVFLTASIPKRSAVPPSDRSSFLIRPHLRDQRAVEMEERHQAWEFFKYRKAL